MADPNQTADLPEPDAHGWRTILCAPKDNVIVLTDGGQLWQGFWADGYGWITGYHSGAIFIRVTLEPTHWQPLLKGPVT